VPGFLSQSIYFARNIVNATAGANTVTIKFSQPPAFPDIRVLVYAGLDPNSPLDAVATASGNSSVASSGPAPTTNAIDLLFGADTIYTTTPGPGTGFISRIIIQPDSDIAEDMTVNSTGSYSATAPLSSPGAWVMHLIAFKQAGAGPPDTTPRSARSNLTANGASSTQISLSWTASTDDVGVTCYLIERCQGAGGTNFAQIATIPAGTTYSDTDLTVLTSYSYRVRATDAAGNLSACSKIASATTLSAPPPPPNITFIQVNATAPQSSLATVNLPFTLAQTAANLNVVIVGWNDSTTTVTSVSDSSGNTYDHQRQ
jgi:chitodextrinase